MDSSNKQQQTTEDQQQPMQLTEYLKTHPGTVLIGLAFVLVFGLIIAYEVNQRAERNARIQYDISRATSDSDLDNLLETYKDPNATATITLEKLMRAVSNQVPNDDSTPLPKDPDYTKALSILDTMSEKDNGMTKSPELTIWARQLDIVVKENVMIEAELATEEAEAKVQAEKDKRKRATDKVKREEKAAKLKADQAATRAKIKEEAAAKAKEEAKNSETPENN